MDEIIKGIQVIKMYAWEKPFSKVVAKLRQNEIRVIRYVSWIRGILVSFIIFPSRTSIFLSLALYVVLGNVMTSYHAFVITAFYNVVNVSMLVSFPNSVTILAETRVSVKRLEKFMLSEEFEITSKTNGTDEDADVQPEIILSDISAKWNEESPEPNLKNINLKLRNSNVVVIIGKVGAGKSTLLQAILSEIPIDSGDLQISGKISYASQEPWIFASSVRKNILFGEKMDKSRYETVVRVCALERDFELFPHGDETIVGERGTSLSGGQKARIGLARAVYRKADIYLLDDPLSAVDTHVGRHLFDSCIKDFLKDKLVILVTHQLQYLQYVDKIVVLNNGSIDEIGTYENLKESGLDFAKLLPDETEREVEQVDGTSLEVEQSKENEELTYHVTQSKSNSGYSPLKLNENSDETIPENDSESEQSKMLQKTSRVNSLNKPVINESKKEQQVYDENRSDGSIGLFHYKSYLKAAGGYFLWLIVTVFFILAQLSASAGDYYLSYWVSNEKTRSMNSQVKALNDTTNLEFDERSNVDLLIFTAITLATIFFTLTRSFLFFNQAMLSSKTLHNLMFIGITKASMFFFNTNPSGRILNRFSKDIGQIDENLPIVMIDVVQIFLALTGIVVVVTTVNPLFLVPTFFIAVIFYYLRSFYLKTSRDLKRLEATSEFIMEIFLYMNN